MPFGSGPSVNHSGGYDYWRTWFIEECEESQLFGATKKHLGLITLDGVGLPSYRVGTRLFLEDAPYFRGSKTHHRICGPYEVFALEQLPEDAEPIHIINGSIIVFKVPQPQNGPWLNHSSIVRVIDGIKVRFQQIANRFDYFPYRFAIRKAKDYKIQHIPHQARECWLCQ